MRVLSSQELNRAAQARQLPLASRRQLDGALEPPRSVSRTQKAEVADEWRRLEAWLRAS